MAQQVITKLIDDLDGGEATDTLIFGLDGRTYEIDLSDPNADALRSFLEPYIKAGRKTAGGPGRKPGQSAPRAVSKGTSGPDTSAVRAWARENGYEVSDRGRVPAPIREAYEKANA
jgi:hypothetical protein